MNSGQPTAGTGRFGRPGPHICSAAMPAAPHTMIPTIAIASMAKSLPINTESIGTAAARISMILLDFSSTRLDSTMPASSMTSRNSSACPACPVSNCARCSPPALESTGSSRMGCNRSVPLRAWLISSASSGPISSASALVAVSTG